MMVLFDVFKCLIRGINELKDRLFTINEQTKRAAFVQPTGYNKNKNFDNRRISRTCVLGAQKNRLIETLLLNA